MGQQIRHRPHVAAATAPRDGDQFQRDLIALAPHLRAFSRTLCGRRDMAEDLAQEAMMNAWRARGSFTAGTNLKAWVFTILRNAFYSQGRRAWRQAHWDEDSANRLEGPPDKQDWTVELTDTVRALSGLPDTQREAIILIGAGGFSYEEAARICGAAVGTMKSRVARGRAALLTALDSNEPLPHLGAEHAANASDDILSQMSALIASSTRRTAHA